MSTVNVFSITPSESITSQVSAYQSVRVSPHSVRLRTARDTYIRREFMHFHHLFIGLFYPILTVLSSDLPCERLASKFRLSITLVFIPCLLVRAYRTCCNVRLTAPLASGIEYSRHLLFSSDEWRNSIRIARGYPLSKPTIKKTRMIECFSKDDLVFRRNSKRNYITYDRERDRHVKNRKHHDQAPKRKKSLASFSIEDMADARNFGEVRR